MSPHPRYVVCRQIVFWEPAQIFACRKTLSWEAAQIFAWRQILSWEAAQIFVCRQILFWEPVQIFVWQANTLWKTCAKICLEANTFLRSCANMCLQAFTLWRTCANICLAGKHSLEKLLKYLSGGKYCPWTNTPNYFLYLLWIFVQGVKQLQLKGQDRNLLTKQQNPGEYLRPRMYMFKKTRSATGVKFFFRWRILHRSCMAESAKAIRLWRPINNAPSQAHLHHQVQATSATTKKKQS